MSTIQAIQTAAMAPLAQAESLPFSAYTDPDVFTVECAKIFSKEWVFVCMQGELPTPGDYYATILANEPICVIHSDDGSLRAMSNVCRHRGTTLLDDGFGKVDKYITCPYHAWAYRTDGALEAVPYNKIIAVEKAAHRLTQFRISIWNGLVFVNLDDTAPPLEERLSGINDYLRLFAPETFTEVNQGDVELWETNWKLAMENAMESYHLFKVHKTTLETFSPTRDAYYIAGSSEWALTGGLTQRKKGIVEKLLGSQHNELYDHYMLVSLPPSFVGVLSYGSFGWLSAHPVNETTTKIRSGATHAGGSMQGTAQMDAFTKAFFLEDKEMCERIQRGMRSRLSKGGKLVDMEQVVVDFHNYLGVRLGERPRTALLEEEMASRWKRAR